MKFLHFFYLVDIPFTESGLFYEGLLGIASVIIVGAGCIHLLRIKHLNANGIMVSGIIYDYERESNRDGSDIYYPVVRL